MGTIGGGGLAVEQKGPTLLAVTKTTFDQQLANGNSIHTESHVLMARDGAGRVMTQAMGLCVRGENGQPIPKYSVNIREGGGDTPSTTMFWTAGDGSDGTAYVSHLQTSAMQTRRSPSQAVMPSSSEYKRGYLGNKTIGGVSAQGYRETRTIPAGEEGNAQELVSVMETWKSTDLKMVVMEVQDNPKRTHGHCC